MNGRKASQNRSKIGFNLVEHRLVITHQVHLVDRYHQLLNAQQTYQNALLSRVRAQAARYSDTAALFQALGGGWWNRDVDGNPAPAKRATCKTPMHPPAPQAWPGPSTVAGASK